MKNESEYKRNFSLVVAYEFLREKGLTTDADSIQFSRDRFGAYSSTLKRAKIVRVLDDSGLLEKFIDSHWPSGKTTKGETRLRFWRVLYDRFMGAAKESEEEEEEVETLEESQFAYENDLRNYLAKNLHLIEPGLKLYKGSDGTPGLEFPIDNTGRRIDILAVDRSGLPVVIELKVRRGHERTIGQVLYYQSMVKRLLAAPSARIVIVAREISEELRVGSEDIPNVELFEYKLSMELQRVQRGFA